MYTKQDVLVLQLGWTDKTIGTLVYFMPPNIHLGAIEEYQCIGNQYTENISKNKDLQLQNKTKLVKP